MRFRSVGEKGKTSCKSFRSLRRFSFAWDNSISGYCLSLMSESLLSSVSLNLDCRNPLCPDLIGSFSGEEMKISSVVMIHITGLHKRHTFMMVFDDSVIHRTLGYEGERNAMASKE